MSETKFYFASFEISGTLPYEDQYDPSLPPEERKRNALDMYLNYRDAVVRTEGGNWYFGRIEEYQELIYGKFGKTYSDEPTRYDESVGDFVELDEEMTDADYSMFIIDFERRLLIFSSTYRVRNSNFVKNFEKGFQNVFNEAAEIELTLIENDESLETVLEEYPIYQFEAELRPTNPGPDPAFEDLDDSMQEMLVKTLGISAERFEDEGINMEEDFLQQVASMSMSEYGESWRVQYGDDQVLKVISSDSEPATTQIDEEIDGLGALRNYSQELLDNARAFLE